MEGAETADDLSRNSVYIHQGLEYEKFLSALKTLVWPRTAPRGTVGAVRGAGTTLLYIYTCCIDG